MATIWTIALFVISLNPIGAVVALVISLIDLIVVFATLGEWNIARAITVFFYEAMVLTYLDTADFTGAGATPLDPDHGMEVGGGVKVTDRFVGTVKRTGDADGDDLEDSYVHGGLGASALGAIAAPKLVPMECSISGRTKTCQHNVQADYRFDSPQVNAWLSFHHRIRAVHYTQGCTLAGLICWRDWHQTCLPEDLDEDEQWGWNGFHVDVLPNTLPGLLAWDVALDNPDRDGDEILNGVEVSSLGTDPDNWDTDGDGLSDKFEFDAQADLGTDPLSADTDGDGLSDGLEYRVRTRIGNPDSDSDGLLDSEEVYHQDGTGEWVGGWQVNLPDVAQPQTAWVLSDPLQADADHDHLNDFSERANGTSPYGFNDAPRLMLEADPLAANPDGTMGAYLEPGDAVTLTLTLDSVGPLPITTDLTSACQAF